MQELVDKVAVVTGGGSGIGRGMALAFADSGMHVVLADIEADAANAVAKEVTERGVKALPLEVDVTDRAAVESLAERTFAELGAAHVLCNNAGVAVFGPLDKMSDDDWRFVLSVNLEGVVHGLQAFLPRMRDVSGEKHIVNTASGAGLIAFPTLGAYTATKYAVVGISETLRQEVAQHSIGVSVLCPGVVNTRIFESERNRPDALGGREAQPPLQIGGVSAQAQDNPGMMRGMDPEIVGRIVRDAVLANEAYIFPHPDLRANVEARFKGISASFDWAQRWHKENPS